MVNGLFSHIRILAAFQRHAIDSIALKSMLDLCFNCFKTRLPGSLRWSVRGEAEAAHDHQSIHDSTQGGATLSRGGVWRLRRPLETAPPRRRAAGESGVLGRPHITNAGTPGIPVLKLSKQSSSVLFRARESIAGR